MGITLGQVFNYATNYVAAEAASNTIKAVGAFENARGRMLGDSSLLVTQSQQDRVLLEIAKEFKLKGLPRAQEYLEHFLDATGKDKHFPCALLLKEDDAVRTFVVNEICALLRGKRPRQLKGNMPVDPASEKYKKAYSRIPVPQITFSNMDWRYATGSFVFDWERVAPYSDSHSIVRIWGRDLYQWHPGESRASQLAHQAGERLVRGGWAANFWMIADPCSYIILDYHGKEVEEPTIERPQSPDTSQKL